MSGLLPFCLFGFVFVCIDIFAPGGKMARAPAFVVSCSRVRQVGVGVNSDLSKLRKQYGVDGRAGLDPAAASRRHLSDIAGNFSLSALYLMLLQRPLPPRTKASGWVHGSRR